MPTDTPTPREILDAIRPLAEQATGAYLDRGRTRFRGELALRWPAIAAILERHDEVVGLDGPWPVADVLRRLADAGEHLLSDHNCDRHGYEEVGVCVEMARKHADRIDAAIRGGGVTPEASPPQTPESPA